MKFMMVDYNIYLPNHKLINVIVKLYYIAYFLILFSSLFSLSLIIWPSQNSQLLPIFNSYFFYLEVAANTQ